MRISITDQINDAIEIAGISPNNNSYIIVSIGKNSSLKPFNTWIYNNLNYSSDVNLNNMTQFLKSHNLKINYQKKSNLELELLSYSAVKLITKSSINI